MNIPYLGEILSFTSAMLWAMAVILFKKSGETVHPIALNLFKDLLAAVLFVPTILLFGISMFPEVPLSHVLILFGSGIIGIAAGDTLFLKSLNLLGASLTGIVYCMYSPFIIILSYLILGENITVIQGIGVFSIISAVLIATQRRTEVEAAKKKKVLGLLIAVVANLCFAAGVVMIKPLLGEYPVLWSTEIRLLGGVFGLIVLLIFHRSRRKIITSIMSKESWSYTISGSFTGAYLAMLTWLAGMKFTQASIASALNQTNTVFIFIFAAIFLKEPMNRRRILAVLLAVIGALLVSLGG